MIWTINKMVPRNDLHISDNPYPKILERSSYESLVSGVVLLVLTLKDYIKSQRERENDGKTTESRIIKDTHIDGF